MPICTSCTHRASYLYTVYESEHNLRLEQCKHCQAFLDPYVEFDTLTLFLDLILLKRGVYRHLLYNRGAEPRRLVDGKLAQDAEENEASSNEVETPLLGPFDNREKHRWTLTFRLGIALVFLDSFIRWSYLNPDHSVTISPLTEETLKGFSRVFLGCFAETVAFHLGIMTVCSIILTIVDWIKARKKVPRPVSDIRREFRLSLIPLSLLYSSLTKLCLLFLLTIWLPTSTPLSPRHDRSPPNLGSLFRNNTYMTSALQILDDEMVDREWIIRNVLGGMAAGFGLRTILDIHPFFTTIIILGGWASKSAVAALLSGWVGGEGRSREAWLAYSIP